MEKKPYSKPQVTIVDLETSTPILAGSNPSWMDDKPDSVCTHGHNPHCDD